jgi:hypothetical protein
MLEDSIPIIAVGLIFSTSLIKALAKPLSIEKKERKCLQ